MNDGVSTSLSVAQKPTIIRPPAPRFRGSSVYPLVLLVCMSVLVLLPVGMLIYTSFRSDAPGTPGATFSLEAWRWLLSADSLAAIGNTVVIGVLTTILSVPIGLLFAWLQVQTNTPLMKQISSLFIVPLVFSPLITTIAWMVLASPRAGMVNVLLRNTLGLNITFNIYSLPGMVFVSVLYYIPIAYLAIRAPLQRIDAGVVEAARTGGAGLWVILRRILIPLLTPVLGIACLLVFSLSIGLFSVVTLLGPTARVMTLQADAYNAIINTPANPPQAAVVATFLLIVTLVGFTAYRRLVRKPARYVTITGRGFRPLVFDLGPMRWVMMALALIYVLAGVVLPYLAIAYAAFRPFLLPRLYFTGFTLSNFRQYADDGNMMLGIKNSLILVLVGSAVIALAASAIGYIAARGHSRVARALEAVSLLPLAIPGLSFALGMLWAVLQIPVVSDYLYGTLLLIFLTQFTAFLPLAMEIASSAVTQLGVDIEDAARICGAPPAARLRRVVVPLLWPTIASVWLILALHVSTEAGLSIFLFTSTSFTMAINVFLSAQIGNASTTYAGALVLASFGIVAIVIGQFAFGAASTLGGKRGIAPRRRVRATP